MKREPITGDQVLKLLGDLRAGRQDLASPLCALTLVGRECQKRHLVETPEGRWAALTGLVSELCLNQAAQALGQQPQRLRILAEQSGEALFDLLRQAYDSHGSKPLGLAWAYLYVRFIAPCRLQHKELERRVRGDCGAADSNAFWNQLKNKEAVPALARLLDQLDAESQPSLAPEPALRRRLPPILEPGLVGRQRIRQKALETIRSEPLVTLTGPGGIGKTSLAAQLAWGLSDSFPDGLVWVDLSRITAPAQLAARFWQEVEPGRPLPEDPLLSLAALLQGQRLLLILDNCEHLLPAVADIVEGLLQAGPALRILATSRHPLKLAQERVLRLGPLSLPPAGELEDLEGYDAVRAFVREARRQNPAFELTDERAPIVAAIVRHLEGLPLAIKLVAPWTRQLSVTEILDQLDALLARGADADRHLPERHRTLVACLRWSQNLLADTDREVFEQLAVFRGGWTTEAVSAICRPSAGPLSDTDSLEVILRLVDLSLVELDTSGCRARGRLPELIRRSVWAGFAGRGDAEPLRQRHADFYLALAEQAEADREHQGGDAWLHQLDTELPNLQAAIDWAEAGGHPAYSLRLATALCRHHLRRGLGSEARAALERGLDDPTAGALSLPIRARAHNAAGNLALLAADGDEAERHYRNAVALLRGQGGHPLLLLQSLHNLGSAQMARGDLAGAEACFEEALSLAAEGSERVLAVIERNLANLALMGGNPRAALHWLDRSEATWLKIDDAYEIALCLLTRGSAESHLGHGASAQRALADAAAAFEAAGDARRALEALSFLAGAALQHLDLAAASDALSQAEALESKADDPLHSVMLRFLLARRAMLSGDAPGAAEALRRLTVRLGPDQPAALFIQLDIEQAWAQRAMGVPDEARRLARRGLARLRQGDMLADPYLPLEVLEAVATCETSALGAPWVAELRRIRRAAGLPYSLLDRVRCGGAPIGGPDRTDATRATATDWRARLKDLADEMAKHDDEGWEAPSLAFAL